MSFPIMFRTRRRAVRVSRSDMRSDMQFARGPGTIRDVAHIAIENASPSVSRIDLCIVFGGSMFCACCVGLLHYHASPRHVSHIAIGFKETPNRKSNCN